MICTQPTYLNYGSIIQFRKSANSRVSCYAAGVDVRVSYTISSRLLTPDGL